MGDDDASGDDDDTGDDDTGDDDTGDDDTGDDDDAGELVAGEIPAGVDLSTGTVFTGDDLWDEDIDFAIEYVMGDDIGVEASWWGVTFFCVLEGAYATPADVAADVGNCDWPTLYHYGSWSNVGLILDDAAGGRYAFLFTAFNDPAMTMEYIAM